MNNAAFAEFSSGKTTAVRNQRGAVLMVALIMLLLMSLIATTGAKTSLLEEKMAGNNRERNLAFQSAETALNAAETFLAQNAALNFSAAGTNGLYSETGAPPTQNDNWSTFNTVTYSSASLSHVAGNPLYVVQRVRSIPDSYEASDYRESQLYRITARGAGGTSNSVVVVQAVYRK